MCLANRRPSIPDCPALLNTDRVAADDTPTVVAAGILAATLASVCHETLGHGVGCVVDGGRITLLTSIWFRCRGAGSLTDAGGSIASLIGGIVAVVVWARLRRGGALRLILLMFAALSLFWFAAQLISHAATNRDDWAAIARREGWNGIWRPICVLVGGAAYAAIVRLMIVLLRREGQGSIGPAYAASAISAAIAGLMWSQAPLRSAMEGLLTLGVDPLGLLAAAAIAGRDLPRTLSPIPRSPTLIAISTLTYAFFLLVQARGLGPLANLGLPH